MNAKDQNSRSRTQVEDEIAKTIAPRTMNGESKNGNLDAMKVLDKASDVLDVVMEWAHERVVHDIRKEMQGKRLKVIHSADVELLRELITEMKEKIAVVESIEENDAQDADSWLDGLELNYES